MLEAKQHVVASVQAAEVNRLLRLVQRVLPDSDPVHAREALGALLVSMDRYRAYVVPGAPVDPEQRAVLEGAAERARGLLSPSARTSLDLVVALATGEAPVEADRALVDDFVVRFQQTSARLARSSRTPRSTAVPLTAPPVGDTRALSTDRRVPRLRQDSSRLALDDDTLTTHDTIVPGDERAGS